MIINCDWCGDEAAIFLSYTDGDFSEVLAYCDRCNDEHNDTTEYEVKITLGEYLAILAMQQL